MYIITGYTMNPVFLGVFRLSLVQSSPKLVITSDIGLELVAFNLAQHHCPSREKTKPSGPNPRADWPYGMNHQNYPTSQFLYGGVHQWGIPHSWMVYHPFDLDLFSSSKRPQTWSFDWSWVDLNHTKNEPSEAFNKWGVAPVIIYFNLIFPYKSSVGPPFVETPQFIPK